MSKSRRQKVSAVPTRPVLPIREEFLHAALSALPGLGVTLLGLLINAHFVLESWPLFLIFGVGLYVGTLTTLGATSHPDRP